MQAKAEEAQVDSHELDELRTQVAMLATQCGHLESANLAWQNFHQTQIDGLKKKLEPFVSTDEAESSARSIDDMLDELLRNRESVAQPLTDFPTIKEEPQLTTEVKAEPTDEPSTDFTNPLNEELNRLRQQYEELENFNQTLGQEKNELLDRLTLLEAQPTREEPIDESSADSINQLNVELNRLRQQYEELENFNRTLGQEKDELIERLTSLEAQPIREEPTDEPSTDFNNQLNDELNRLRSQYDELENFNRTLTDRLTVLEARPIPEEPIVIRAETNDVRSC